MVERILRFFLLVALAAAPLSGCAYMTQSGRQQMAYQRYVRKCSGRQMKVKKKMKAPKMPKNPGPSENKINAEAESPQSVTSGESQQSDQ